VKVTINIELEGQPNKLGQDFADWCKSMRADIDRLTVSGQVPDPVIVLREPSKHEPEKDPEAALDKDKGVASNVRIATRDGIFTEQEYAAMERGDAPYRGMPENASNHYVPPKYLRDEPKSDTERQHAAAQKLDAVKVDPFRPLIVNSTECARFNAHMVREFNYMLDKRRLEFRETLLRVFSDVTSGERREIMRMSLRGMKVDEVFNELLRRRRGEA